MSLFAGLAQFGSDLLNNWMADERQEDALHAQEQNLRHQEAVQREFAQHGIRWRVEDAKAAGLHPLFALGGGGASYTPMALVSGGGFGGGVDWSKSGQAIARAVEQYFKDTSAHNFDRTGGTMEGEWNWPVPGQVDFAPAPEDYRWSMDMFPTQSGSEVNVYKVNPAEIISASPLDPSVTAGPTHPMWTVYWWDRHFPIKGPFASGEHPLEVMGEMDIPEKLALIRLNVATFGPEWLEMVRERIPTWFTLYQASRGVRNVEEGIGKGVKAYEKFMGDWDWADVLNWRKDLAVRRMMRGEVNKGR